MNIIGNPYVTYIALLAVQTAHLLHHRLAKRHISFAEVASSAILCVPLTLGLPAWLYTTAHLAMIAVQIVGSLWIRTLSPAWQKGDDGRPPAGRRGRRHLFAHGQRLTREA